MEAEREDVRQCALCGSSERKTVFVERDFPIVKCLQCGLVYVTPRLTQDKIGRLVDAFSRGDQEQVLTETGLALPWEAESPREKDRYKECLQTLLDLLPPGGRRLIDVGTGNGNLAIQAQQMGFEPFAFDVMPAHIERLAREKGIKGAVAPSLQEAGLPTGGFDAVTLWDVLEHLPHPQEELGEIHRILKPGGVMALKSPNYEWLILKTRLADGLKSARFLQRMKVMTHFGFFAPEVHLYNYTSRTLEGMLSRCGFRLLKISLSRSSEQSSRLSLILHDMVTYTARGLYALSLKRMNLNPSLTAYAVREG